MFDEVLNMPLVPFLCSPKKVRAGDIFEDNCKDKKKYMLCHNDGTVLLDYCKRGNFIHLFFPFFHI